MAARDFGASAIAGAYSRHQDLGVDTTVDALTAQIEREAQALAARARKSGRVLAIEQVSVAPWASGRHVDLVSVCPARKPGGKY